MKTLIVFALTLSTLNLWAADGVDCFNRAEKEIVTNLEISPVELYVALCEGAKSTAPIDCFMAAKPVLADEDHTAVSLNGKILALCTKATSTAPVDCFKRAKKKLAQTDNPTYLNTVFALRLCGQKLK